MAGLISKYRKKTPKSAKLFAKSTKYHVNGVSHNIRFFEPYPFVTRSAKGKSLIDVDGNKYTDYWNGHWSLILGHSPRVIRNKVAEQLGRGWMHGTVNEPTIMLSEQIQGAVPVAEKIRYVTSGTEATMYATRLARSVTGKKVIAKIDGGWHGYTSDLLKTVNWPFSKSESSGLLNQEQIVSIPYNNLEESIKILESVRKNLAGIIVEPVLGGGGCIPATQEYLNGIQEFVHKNDSLFILDEIVTGFRFRYGCIYPTMKLKPDIVTLGQKARSDIDKTFDGRVITTGRGSLFMTHFVQGTKKITNAADAAMCDTDLLYKYHFKMIAEDGIFFLPGKLGAISDAHGESDIKRMVSATEDFVQHDL